MPQYFLDFTIMAYFTVTLFLIFHNIIAFQVIVQYQFADVTRRSPAAGGGPARARRPRPGGEPEPQLPVDAATH